MGVKIMAIIVEYQKDNKKYIYIGASYSYFKEVTPSFFGGNLFPNQEEGEFNCILASDQEGKLIWLPATEVKVISVDGKRPDEIL
jgi:hypothetical protein